MSLTNKKIIAIVPARRGSKRIPQKNVKHFYGKPIIKWPLEVLKQSKIIDEIIISTDCEDVISISEEMGIKVPFLRPKELSDDITGTAAVIKHALEWYIQNKGNVDYVLTVYPTAVFLRNEDIIEAYEMIKNDENDIIFTGTEYAYPIQRAVFLDENKKVKMFEPKHMITRSQDLKKSYHDAGQFYFAKSSAVLSEISALSQLSSMIVLPRERVFDIDTQEDFNLAEKMFKLQLKDNKF